MDKHKSDELRLQLQQIAHFQKARANEQRLQHELNLRKAEWSRCVSSYISAVEMLDRLQSIALQAVRNENIVACLRAAHIEIATVRNSFGRVVETMGSLNGININSESIKTVNDANRYL